MAETEAILSNVIAGLQEQKARRIVTADLSGIENCICRYMVICEGTSNTHVSALADNMKDYVRKEAGEKAMATEGMENCLWVVVDYGDVMVHIMQREPREFYDLEHLWEDARLDEIPDDEP